MEDGIISDRNTDNPSTVKLTITRKRRKGEKMAKFLCKSLEKLKSDSMAQLIYKASRLSGRFDIKDRTPKKHIQLRCPESNCNLSYIGETARRLQTRISEHIGKD